MKGDSIIYGATVVDLDRNLRLNSAGQLCKRAALCTPRELLTDGIPTEWMLVTETGGHLAFDQTRPMLPRSVTAQTLSLPLWQNSNKCSAESKIDQFFHIFFRSDFNKSFVYFRGNTRASRQLQHISAPGEINWICRRGFCAKLRQLLHDQDATTSLLTTSHQQSAAATIDTFCGLKYPVALSAAVNLGGSIQLVAT